MPSQEEFFPSYIAHHWAAAKGGLDLFNRAARSQSSAQVRQTLQVLAGEVAEDRRRLRTIADAVGVGQERVAQTVLSVGETLSRLKLNGRLIRRSPLSDVLEIEALISAVQGKRAGWEGMRVIAKTDTRLDEEMLLDLINRADDQLNQLSQLHDIVMHGINPVNPITR